MIINEADFRFAINAVADAILLIDSAALRFIDCNDTACHMLGYSRKELITLGPIDIDAGHDDQLLDSYEETKKGKNVPPVEAIIRHKDGSSLPVEIHFKALLLNERQVLTLVIRDITERKKSESNFQPLAYFDPLTGLPNRQTFFRSLHNALAQAKKQSLTISLLLISLDKFRGVNDALGYKLGDQLLQQIGKRLLSNLRIRDVVGSLGGDEFGIILFNSADSEGAFVVANKVLHILRQPFNLDWHKASVTASVGISTSPSDTSDVDTMIRYADSALRAANLAGGNVARYYTAEMNAKMLEKRDLHDALNLAIINEEFVLHYQPKVHIETGKWDSVEALIRWNRPGHGLVSPALFIPALEETGMISLVGSWGIKAVCRQVSSWEQLGICPIRIAINLSAKQFQQEDLASAFEEAIQENEINPSSLEVEITESMLMMDTERTIATLHKLGGLGVHIAIDDFGTGYSSLAYIQKFPVNKLKIDIAFIRNVTTNVGDAAIVVAIINMAHSMNLKVIAEGVETKEQMEFLRAHKCDKYQGYYFSRPLPAFELERLWQQARPSDLRPEFSTALN